ncbi:hypothetical protein E8P77_31160 [Soehngenia saccharolytica]|nr:hypothetical protein E8P77_31160 [Soehngenia saccharolytica]
MAKQTTNIFTGEPKYASGGRIQLFSTAANASVKGPEKPHINKGDPGHHDNQPVNPSKEPRKDKVSDHHEKTEEKNK